MFDRIDILERVGALSVRRFSVADVSRIDNRLAELLSIEPSVETLAEIDGYDPAELDDGERVTLLALWERHAAWLAARQQQAIVDVVGLAAASKSTDDWAAEIDVAAALRLSPVSASRRVDVARQLSGRLSATQDALAAGRITFWYALSLVEGVVDLDDDAAREVERVALDGAEKLSLTRFRARLRRAVIAAAPAIADERHDAAVAERRVVLSPQPDGMAWLSAFLTAPEAIAAYNALNAVVRTNDVSISGSGLPSDGAPNSGPRFTDPIDSRRADAFVAALLGAASSDSVPGVPGVIATSVNMTVDSATLLRLAEHPGHLEGYGDIPPELARRLAAGSGSSPSP